MKKILLIYVLLFLLANVQANIYIRSADFKECESNSQIKIEVGGVSDTPINSPLSFNIKLKGIEESPASCMIEDFPTNAVSEDSNNDETTGEYEFAATCTAESPKHGGNYFVEVDPDSNEGVEVIEGTVYLTFSPCLSQDEADERKDLSLSFRQVNTFDLNSFSFMFYALTSQTINSDATIKFYFNFLDEYRNALPSPVEANCTIEEPVTEIDQSIGVAPASFRCLFDEEYVTDQVSSLQITSADGVAGLPIDDDILKNPKLTDDAINDGLLTNPATEGGNLPSIINPGDSLVKYNEEQGVFTMVFEYTQGNVNVQVDKWIRIPLTYPGGIILEGNIIKKEDTSLTIRFGVKGEINSIPLIWEQKIISFNGEELFVLPSYKTDSITTKGFSGTYEEEEPNEEHDHGQEIIEDGGNTQGPQEQGEVIIDDGGNTQEEHGGEVIDDGGERTQEEIIDDDDDKNKPKILSGSFLECDFNGQIKLEVTVTTDGPLTSPLNFFINLKGIEEFSAH